jgi:hypothetical protein
MERLKTNKEQILIESDIIDKTSENIKQSEEKIANLNENQQKTPEIDQQINEEKRKLGEQKTVLLNSQNKLEQNKKVYEENYAKIDRYKNTIGNLQNTANYSDYTKLKIKISNSEIKLTKITKTMPVAQGSVAVAVPKLNSVISEDKSNVIIKGEKIVRTQLTEIDSIQKTIAAENANLKKITTPEFTNIDAQIKENEKNIVKNEKNIKLYETQTEYANFNIKNRIEIIGDIEKNIKSLKTSNQTPDIQKQISEQESNLANAKQELLNDKEQLKKINSFNNNSVQSINESKQKIEAYRQTQGYSDYIALKNTISTSENNLQQKQTLINQDLQKLQELNKTNPIESFRNKILTPDEIVQKNTELTEKLRKNSDDLAIIKSNIDKNKTELDTLKTPELNAKLQVIESSRSIISESENIISSFEKEIEQTKQVQSQLYKEIMAINKEMKPLEKSNKPDDQAKYKNLSNTYKKLNLDVHNKVYNKQRSLNNKISYEEKKIQANKEIIIENENSSDIKHFRATENNIILNKKMLLMTETQKSQTEIQLKALNVLKKKTLTHLAPGPAQAQTPPLVTAPAPAQLITAKTPYNNFNPNTQVDQYSNLAPVAQASEPASGPAKVKNQNPQ